MHDGESKEVQSRRVVEGASSEAIVFASSTNAQLTAIVRNLGRNPMRRPKSMMEL